MPASIVVNQATRSAGTAGKARSDGVVSQLVTCTNNTAESTYAWVLVDAPIRSALVRGTTGVGASFTFTPDVKGTYTVSLRVNGSSADVDNDSSYLAIRTFAAGTLGWRYQAAGETTEDNETYAGLGFPSNINPRGWATNEDVVFEAIEAGIWQVQNGLTTFGGVVQRLVYTDPATGKVNASLIAGTAPTGPAGGDLNGNYPNPGVVGLQGRAVSATPPASTNVLAWNGSAWAPAAASSGGSASPILIAITSHTQLTIIHDSLNNGSTGAVSKSDVTSAQGTPAIQIVVAGTNNVDGGFALAITDPAFIIPTGAGGVRRYTICCRLLLTPTAATFGGFGPGWAMSKTTGAGAFAIGAAPQWGSNYSNPCRVQAGAFHTGGANPSGAGLLPLNPLGGMLFDVECDVVMTPAAGGSGPPGFVVNTRVVPGGTNGSGGDFVSKSDVYAGGGFLSTFTGWNVALDTCGLIGCSAGAGTPNYTVQIDNFYVKRHPADF